jgi:hypothetical protein
VKLPDCFKREFAIPSLDKRFHAITKNGTVTAPLRRAPDRSRKALNNWREIAFTLLRFCTNGGAVFSKYVNVCSRQLS